MLAISGLGGVGKTSRALESVWDIQEKFPGGIYWLTADSDIGYNTLKASLFGLAKQMDPNSSKFDSDIWVQVVTGHLKDQDRSLLVIDNLDSEDFSPLVT